MCDVMRRPQDLLASACRDPFAVFHFKPLQAGKLPPRAPAHPIRTPEEKPYGEDAGESLSDLGRSDVAIISPGS
jgi:hypothetical protein